MFKPAAFMLLMALLPMFATADDDIRTATHEYKVGDKVHEAFIAHDADDDGPEGAVLIVHQWKGISDHERDIARRLADEGYFVFCADIYGKDVRPADSGEAGKLAGQYRGGDRAIFRESLAAALNELKTKFPGQVDPNRIVAIGYCFGGTGVLEMARANMDVKGVASFHGGLSKGEGETAAEIKPRVLVLHGAADPLVPPGEVLGLQDELTAAKADWELVSYGGAVHSFTDRKANSDASRYQPEADARSWERLDDFLEELIED
jgi:dienelactone hydrolase